MLMNAWGAALGQPAYVTAKVAELTSRPARALRQSASDHATAFWPA